jgi:predicted DNA-binding transcriptional regulator YafY
MSTLPGPAHVTLRPARQLLLDKRFQRGEPAQGQRDHVTANVTGTILHEKQVRRGPKLGPPERLETGETIKIHHGTNSLPLRCCLVIEPSCCQHAVSIGETVFDKRAAERLAKRFAMRRADRLFQIIQVLRRTRKPLTADAIAAELETSKRTVYRDIATLIGQRVPIRGEAGMGYILEKGFDLPPLMLTPDEIEAAVLGAQWVAGHADPVLARAADDLIAKIAETVPERLRPFVLEPASRARPVWKKEPDRIDMVRTRTQIHEGRKITLRYRDEQGRDSERTIWPIAIGYLEAVRLLAAWCELRHDFRSFRTDRVIEADYLGERYPERRDVLRAKWRQSLVWERPGDN